METPQIIAFYPTAILSVFFALCAIFSQKIIRGILYGFISVFCGSIIIIALEQPYLSLTALVLYSVSTLIMLIFALMITNKETDFKINFSPRMFFSIIGIAIISIVIALIIKFNIIYTGIISEEAKTVIMPSIKDFSLQMFINYITPFVLSSLAFLAAITGFGVMFSSHKGGKKQ